METPERKNAFTTVGSSLRPKRGLRKKKKEGRKDTERNVVTALGPLLHIQCTQARTVHPLSTEHTSAALEGSVSLSVIKSQVLLSSCMEKGIQWLERVPWQWLQRHDCALWGGSHRKTRRHITRSTIKLTNLAKRVWRLLQLFLKFTNCPYNQTIAALTGHHKHLSRH